ncbi:MAG TPA: helix-turn-helix domain-containing protein [Solirubrobacteraceae bacterium]
MQVLIEDPGLARHLSGRELAQATAVAIAPLMRVAPGTRRFLVNEPWTHGHLGLLVLDGLIARHVTVGQIAATEFLGPGDILAPWVSPREHAEPVQVRWEVLAPSRLASLDEQFGRRIGPWPQIPAALLDRAAQRADAQVLQAALRQARRVEDRVLLALWHFAGRWGHVGPEGRTVSLPKITGETLARVIGARRQSVSTALGQLVQRGAIERHADGSLTVPSKPPQLRPVQREAIVTEAPAVARRATDQHW